MFPVLFRIGDFPVSSYALLMALGYVAALGALFHVTPKNGDAPNTGGLDRPQVWDLFIVLVVSSLIGAKVGHVLFEAPGHVSSSGKPINTIWELLAEDPWHWIALGEGGYVWYGGMITSLLVAVFYFRRRPHLLAWRYADAFAPAIMLGAAVGRLGCFTAGCCHGLPTELPWGVRFPGQAGPVHPTQLYDATVAASLGFWLLWRYGRRRFEGENLALLLMTYPVLRSLTETLRGDEDRGVYGLVSTSQLLSIPVLLAGLYLYLNLRLRPNGPARAGPEPEAEPEAEPEPSSSPSSESG